MKKISLLILCCSIMSLTTFAQKGKNKCAELKQMKTELKTHYTTQMTPELKIIHTSLISQLSAEDQKIVKNLQAEQEALILEKNKLRKKGKKSAKSGEENAAIQDLKEKYKTINQALKPIVKRNKAAVLAADKAIMAKSGAWKKERKAIKTKYSEYECVTIALEKAQAKGRKRVNTNQRIKPYAKNKKAKKGKKGETGKNKKMRKAAAFLLWSADGSIMPQQLNEK